MTDSFALALRVGLSLAVVLGLMWLAARLLKGHGTGRAAGLLEVVARQQVGRGASVAVVRVGERAYVLGVTESRVALLADTDLDAVAALEQVPTPTGAEVRSPVAAAPRPTGRLTGSILSPSTWRTTVEVMRDRTVRR